MVYLLFVGGSGIRVARSFINLCAAGCFNNTDFKIMLIDTDIKNGDTDKLFETISAYNKISEKTNAFPALDFYKNKNGEIAVWNPLEGLAARTDASMNEILNKAMWDDNSNDVKDLYNFLYTTSEQEIGLDKGFYGHTSIGSYFMVNAISGSSAGTLNPEWSSFFGPNLSDDDTIFVIGSMFGGTGASAIPSIAKILKSVTNTSNAQMGCTIVMPYYDTVAEGSDVGNINSVLFPAKNRAALYYYADQEIYEDFQSMYFVGENKDDFMTLVNKNGGHEQRNKASHVEVYAALTINDFLNTDTGDGIKTYDFEVPAGNINIETLNNINDDIKYADNIINFCKVAILFNKVIKHTASDKKDKWSGFYDEANIPTGDFSVYCKVYTDWIFELLIDTANNGEYGSVETYLSEKDPNLGKFTIMNIAGKDKLKLFTLAMFEKPKGWFKNKYADIECIKDLSPGSDLPSYSGEKIMMRFNDLSNARFESLRQFIDTLTKAVS